MNLLWTERADVQALKIPDAYSQDWFGYLLFSAFPSTLRYRESNLYLNQKSSETRVIKTAIAISIFYCIWIHFEWTN